MIVTAMSNINSLVKYLFILHRHDTEYDIIDNEKGEKEEGWKTWLDWNKQGRTAKAKAATPLRIRKRTKQGFLQLLLSYFLVVFFTQTKETHVTGFFPLMICSPLKTSKRSFHLITKTRSNLHQKNTKYEDDEIDNESAFVSSLSDSLSLESKIKRCPPASIMINQQEDKKSENDKRNKSNPSMKSKQSKKGKKKDYNNSQHYHFWEEQLSISSFNLDLHALGHDDHPQKAQDALEIMEDLYQKDPTNPMHVQPDSSSYTTVIEAWCNYYQLKPHKQEDAEGNDDCNDDDESHSKQKSSMVNNPFYYAEQAQWLLDKMEHECHSSSHHHHLCPNELSYLLVCQKWAELYRYDFTGSAAQRAHDILIRVRNLDRYSKDLNNDERDGKQNHQQSDWRLQLDWNKFYSVVLEGWCRRVGKVRHAMRRAEALLEEIEQEYEKGKQTRQQDAEHSLSPSADTTTSNTNTLLRPNVLMYTNVIGALARSGESDLATRADTLLKRMTKYRRISLEPQQQPQVDGATISLNANINPNVNDITSKKDITMSIEPDMVAYTTILNCWSRARSTRERSIAANKALEILNEMEQLYINHEQYHVKPNAITYATAIKAIGNSLDSWKIPELCEEIIQRMYHYTEAGIIHVPPTVSTYNSLIYALCSSNRQLRGELPAQQTKVSSGTTTTAITSAKTQKVANAKRAEQLLVEMMTRSRTRNEPTIEPNVKTWGGVIRAWSETRQSDAGAQAERVLNRLQEWYEEGKTTVKPNVVCYTTVMNAYGRANTSSSSSKNNHKISSRSNDSSNKYRDKDNENDNEIHHNQRALDNIERLLEQMEALYEETLDADVRPNKITYVTAIDAFCRKSKRMAGIKAQALVDRMMRLYSKGIGYERPTRIVFNALINAWSKTPVPTAALNAEKIFRWMETQYRSGDNYVQPDEVTLCGVLNAWANHAALYDHKVKQQQHKNKQASTKTTTKTNVTASTIRVDDEKADDEQPNTSDANIGSGALRAQQILDHAESIPAEERGFHHSIVCHNIVIKAWGRSRAADAVQRAEAILLRLEEDARQKQEEGFQDSIVRPDVTTYSSVINCCAYYSGNDRRGHEQALQVAVRTFEKLLQQQQEGSSSSPSRGRGGKVSPNNITFGTLFKTIARMAPWNDNRKELIEKYFQRCRECGCVDGFVLSQVKAASPPSLYRKIVLEPVFSSLSSSSSLNEKQNDDNSNNNNDRTIEAILSNMPQEWGRNVFVD